MAETLGMLCDQLTVVKLKQFHAENEEKLKSLQKQAQQLQEEEKTKNRTEYYLLNTE